MYFLEALRRFQLSTTLLLSAVLAIPLLGAGQTSTDSAQNDLQSSTGKDTTAQSSRSEMKAATVKTPRNCDPNFCVLLAWDVLTPKAVRDNYGRYVWDKYFVVDVSVYNASSKQLIIKTMTFVLPGDEQVDQPHVNTEPGIVRGSIVKGQMSGRRNTTVRIIEGIGLLATGATGFFKATASQATFSRSINIFSDPFEKSVKAIFPDTTVTYLENWDKTDIFKKGIIVEANQEARGIIFIPFGIVYPQGDKSLPGKYIRPW